MGARMLDKEILKGLKFSGFKFFYFPHTLSHVLSLLTGLRSYKASWHL